MAQTQTATQVSDALPCGNAGNTLRAGLVAAPQFATMMAGAPDVSRYRARSDFEPPTLRPRPAAVKMANETLRRQIVVEAARLVVGRQEDDYFRAVRKAARRLCAGRIPRADLPAPRELHAELQRIASRHDEGLPSSPYLIDPLLVPDDEDDPFAERVVDRFSVYRALLMPLAQVQLSRTRHPERDALYHSLQVYVLGRDERPYDEEFQLAALLHDVGKGIDPKDHVAAALDALDGFVTERTAWLIEHHDDAHKLREQTLGSRARRRLRATDDFETLELLADCDRRGRVVGAPVPELEDALDEIRSLAESHESEPADEMQP